MRLLEIEMKRRGSYLSASVVSCPVPQKSSRVEICGECFDPRLCLLSGSADGLPSDAEAGLTYMKGLFPAEKFEHKLPAIVMKHQVYSIIHDKTSVDRELVGRSTAHTHTHIIDIRIHTHTLSDYPFTHWLAFIFEAHHSHCCFFSFSQLALRDKGEVRLFKLGLSSDDYAVVYTEDYKAHLRAALALGGAGGRGLGPGGRRDRDRDTPLYRKFTGPVLSSCGDVSISRSQLVGQLKVSTQDIS